MSHAYAMSNSASNSSDDFEYIETPAAPTSAPPQEGYGVRTTTVSAKEPLSGHKSSNWASSFLMVI